MEAKGRQKVSLGRHFLTFTPIEALGTANESQSPHGAEPPPRAIFFHPVLIRFFPFGVYPFPRGCLMRSLCFSDLSHLSLAGGLRLLSRSAFPFALFFAWTAVTWFIFVHFCGRLRIKKHKAHMHRHTHKKFTNGSLSNLISRLLPRTVHTSVLLFYPAPFFNMPTARLWILALAHTPNLPRSPPVLFLSRKVALTFVII